MKITTKGHSKTVSCNRNAMHAESENMNRENVTSHLHDSTNKKLNVLTSDSELPFYRKYLKFLRKFLLSDTRAPVKRTTLSFVSRSKAIHENHATRRNSTLICEKFLSLKTSTYIWSNVKNLSTNMDYFCYHKSFLNRHVMVIRRII